MEFEPVASHEVEFKSRFGFKHWNDNFRFAGKGQIEIGADHLAFRGFRHMRLGSACCANSCMTPDESCCMGCNLLIVLWLAVVGGLVWLMGRNKSLKLDHPKVSDLQRNEVQVTCRIQTADGSSTNIIVTTKTQEVAIKLTEDLRQLM